MSAYWAAKLGVSLEGIYHILQRLRRRQDEVRRRLCALCPPPTCDRPDPLRETAEHMRSALGRKNNPIEAYHLRFQVSLMG